jgi:NAD(P)-dependent dehydrogenase (short-subunit alcohol dehydrogenase family)
MLVRMKTLIVTGGTGGLGPTVVHRLSARYRCVLLAREPAAGDQNQLRADLGDEASVHSAVAMAVGRFGAPYGLVHLAGGYAGGTISETPTETWQQQLSLNLTGAFLAIREVLAVMRRDEPGRIVAVSSEASTMKLTGSAAYTVSKSALNTLIEVVAKDVAGSCITANALLPGTLDTRASREAMPDAKRVPLDSVAAAIEFLLSDEASSINGALLPLRPS